MNIIRLYNQNRKQLFILILIVTFIILTIHFVNYLVKKNNEKDLNNGISSSSTSSATTTYNPQQSAISSSSVSNAIYAKESKLIDDFMKYCNEGNAQKAYELLSSDCKTVMFPTLEYFISNYQKSIFTKDRLYSIQNWTGKIYKIDITENMLSTGKSNNGIAIQDYFTIINEDKDIKLNINGFIGRNQLSKKISNDILSIEAIYEDLYMDYVIYTVKVQNKTDKTILMDSGESTQNMYIIDENKVKYMSYRNEVTDAELKLLPYAENQFQIKFMSAYVSKKSINSLIFKDIVLDYNNYSTYDSKQEYTNRTSIKIEL